MTAVPNKIYTVEQIQENETLLDQLIDHLQLNPDDEFIIEDTENGNKVMLISIEKYNKLNKKSPTV